MAAKLRSLIYKTGNFLLNPIAIAVFSYFVLNCNKLSAAPPTEWDYSLGSKEKFSQPIYTPLKKVESEVLYYPTAGSEKSVAESPLGRDYYTYILPQEVFGIKTIEVEIAEAGAEKTLEKIKADELAKEIEEAIPIIMQAAVKKKTEGLEKTQQYLLRVKAHREAEPAGSEQQPISITVKGETKESPQKKLTENEVDILVNVIFGQGKVIIKIPPLKDPQAQEYLLKELERLAQIMVRQEELLDIEQAPQ